MKTTLKLLASVGMALGLLAQPAAAEGLPTEASSLSVVFIASSLCALTPSARA